jgi:hypothetical protein
MFIFTLSDAISLLLFAILIIAAVVVQLRETIRQSRCKHDEGVNETSACDAICRKCGKNLGFIGAWRERAGSITK